MDSKVHRKNGVLEVFSLWLEEGIRVTSGLEKGLLRAIEEFAIWQSAQRITCGRLPPGLFSDRQQGWEISPA